MGDGWLRYIATPTDPDAREPFERAMEQGVDSSDISTPTKERFPIGTRVALVGGHPWAGSRGTIARWEYVEFKGQEYPVIQLMAGVEVFVFFAAHLQALDVGGQDE